MEIGEGCPSPIGHNVESENIDNYSLLDLPEEMFLHICSFLNVHDLVLSLKLVCKKFYYTLNNESIFKSILASRFGRPYILSLEDKGLQEWQYVCYYLEKDSQSWRKNFESKINSDVHISNIDAIVLFDQGRKCLSGSRDRCITLWDVPTQPLQEPTVITSKVAHQGWVWKLRQFNGSLYSASWDNTIKEFDCSIDIREKQCYSLKSPVLCVSCCSNGVIHGGCFSGIVLGFDPRVGTEPVSSYKAHNHSVLTLDALGYDVISGSEDKTLAIYDTRKQEVKEQITLGEDTYAKFSQVVGDVMFIGDRRGNLRTYKVLNGSLRLENCFNFEHDGGLSALKITQGSVITGTTNGIVTISLALNPPSEVKSFAATGGIICSLDSLNGTVAVGTTNTVGFWLPS